MAPSGSAISAGAVGYALSLLLARVLDWTVSQEHLLSGAAVVLLVPLVRYLLVGFDKPERHHGWVLPAVRDSLLAAALALITVSAVGYFVDVDVSRRLLLVQSALLVLLDSLLGARRRSAAPRGAEVRLAVVCDDAEFEQLAGGVEEHRASAHLMGRPTRIRVVVRLVGVLNDQPVIDITDRAVEARRRHAVPVAPVTEIKSVCDEYAVSLVLVGQGWLRDPQFLAIAESALDAGVSMASLPGFFERHFMRVPITCLDPRWFFDLTHERRASYRRLQQAVGLLAAAVAGVLLLALGPFIAAAIYLESGGPVLFRQSRVGLQGRTFTLLKFRTMITDAEIEGPRFAQVDDPRVTRVGRFLRRTRLDELPQVWNILRRDMAFIGPRPERPEFAGAYADSVPYYRRRLAVPPGLTGWAQVNESYAASEADTIRKLERDLFYLKYQSLSLDLMILARTARSVLHVHGR